MSTFNNRHQELANATRDEAMSLVRDVAGPRGASEAITALISRAATRLGLSYGRTEDIWRREARRIDAWEMDLLRKTARRYRCRSRRT